MIRRPPSRGTLRGALRGARWCAALLLASGVACETPPSEDAAGSVDPRMRELYALQRLQDGRALQLEGRLDAAERVLRRGLEAEPDNADLERALAHTLDALGRPGEAATARARADAIDPPPPPLPSGALPLADGETVALLVLSTEGVHLDEPGRWPEPRVEAALRAHLDRRLPAAVFEHAAPGSTAAAEQLLAERDAARVLTLRVDRADCRFSVKDGAIAVAELRWAAAARGDGAAETGETKSVVGDPGAGEECVVEAVQRALEQALATPAWRRVAATTPEGDAHTGWQAALRPLFPDLSRHVERALRRGRALLGAGQLGEALLVFEEAARIDPRDAEVRAHRDDAKRSLALAREIAQDDDPDTARGVLDPRLSPAQRAAAQVALEREQQRRDELLAALAVLDEDVRAPSQQALSALRPVEIRGPDAFGPRLARERAQREIEARAAYAPDGEVIARYYFARDAREPLVREEDTDGDGAPDRWIAYSGAARREIFEAGGHGQPDLRLVFAEGGEPLERIEVDDTGDGRPERVFRYAGGHLSAEDRDTDGDGVLDRFDRFDAAGLVDVREEDLDGDGAIDVRSEYQHGKLVRREVASPEHVPES